MKNLFTKAKKKISRTLRNNVYRNYFYKPSGAYTSTKEYIATYPDNAGVQYIEIYPGYTSTLSVPEDLCKAVSSYTAYDALAKTTYSVKTNYVIAVIPNGRLYTNNVDMVAVITGDNKLLGDVSLQYHINRIAKPEENLVFKQKYFAHPVKYSGVVFNMLAGGGAINNYGHWLIDVISRIHLLKESGYFEKVNWFLVPSYAYDFHIDTLSFLGISSDKIIVCSGYMHIQADLLISSSHPRGERSHIFPKWVIEFHRNTFLKFTEKLSSSYPALVYISRKDGNTRKVVNEDQLISLLEEYGFKSYELSTLPFIEKVKLFNSAEIIVSATGAGLINLIYARKGAKVIEIFPDVLVHTLNYNLAVAVDMEYHYLISKTSVQAKTLRQAEHVDLTVNLEEVKQLLEQLLVSKSQVMNLD